MGGGAHGRGAAWAVWRGWRGAGVGAYWAGRRTPAISVPSVLRRRSFLLAAVAAPLSSSSKTVAAKLRPESSSMSASMHRRSASTESRRSRRTFTGFTGSMLSASMAGSSNRGLAWGTTLLDDGRRARGLMRSAFWSLDAFWKWSWWMSSGSAPEKTVTRAAPLELSSWLALRCFGVRPSWDACSSTHALKRSVNASDEVTANATALSLTAGAKPSPSFINACSSRISLERTMSYNSYIVSWRSSAMLAGLSERSMVNRVSAHPVLNRSNGRTCQLCARDERSEMDG